MRVFFSLVFLVFIGIGHSAPVSAQRTVRLVVPFAAGSTQDLVARAINQELGLALGANVLVDNRAGAGGTMGAAFVAKAALDGNTLLLAGSGHTLAGHLYPKLAYHPVKDFSAVTLLGFSGMVLAVPSSLGVQSLPEYIKYVKAKPGQLNYASAGQGSATHLAMASLVSKTGLDMVHVPTKSSGEAIAEVLAGRVQGVVAAVPALEAYRNDPRIKLLAYTGLKRSHFLPELPTVAQSAVPAFNFEGWAGVLAPAGTSSSDIEKIHAAVQKALSSAAVQQRFSQLRIESSTMGPAEFQQFLRADWDQAAAVVMDSRIKLD